MLHGIGIGFATSQLTNVVLSDIPPQKAGSASGAAGMVRQVGTALGIALIGAIFVSQATSHVRHDLAKATDIPPAVRAAGRRRASATASAAVRPPGASDTPVGQQVSTLVSKGVADAARPAVAFAGAVVTLGALISLLVPNIPAEHETAPGAAEAWGAGDSDADPGADDEFEPTPT